MTQSEARRVGHKTSWNEGPTTASSATVDRLILNVLALVGNIKVDHETARFSDWFYRSFNAVGRCSYSATQTSLVPVHR